MSNEHMPIALDQCTLPGTINVTRRALDRAERFQAALPAGWIACFSWYDGQRQKASRDAPWVDMGPGIGLGAYEDGDLAEEAVYRAGNFRYAVLIRKDVVEDHPDRTIDVDDDGRLVFT